MAKTSTGRTTTGRTASQPPPAEHAAAPKVAAETAKAATAAKKPAPPNSASAAAKKVAPTIAAPSKKAAVGAKTPVPQKPAATKVAAPAKSAAATRKTATPPKVDAPKKTAASKPVAKTVAVKKAAPRRTATRVAVPVPAARRGRPIPSVRKAPAKKLTGGGPQVFTVSHLNEADFKPDGLRPYAQYRDLGIAAATAGLCQAHVIRLVPPCTDEVRKRHVHQTELQLVYVLKGWMKNEFEGHGEQMMSVGSCWLQPTGIKHTVLDYSPDCEVLEIIVPADFKTEELA